MTAAEKWTTDLSQVRSGDRVEIWDEDYERYIGTVGQVAPHLGVLWILEAGTGVRRLFPFEGCRLRHAPLALAA
ncbi:MULTISPECIES: hypothetical protein [Kocuria]|jgi:hypothetical protein|uniref:hypothetical protein n=1 Tax=Kocuria TaxID=57493 RepID=UPI00203E8C89|nr:MULTISPECIES: hypothetical protein [Kocuria]MCM3687631.1 hypothetical protein [Kocuria rosea]HST71287.1 hypothetical protein [Kocuria rosea]